MTTAISLSALSILIYMTAVFAAALILKDNSVVDIAWGPGFILVGLVNLAWRPYFAPRQVLVLTLIAIWGSRLAVYIFLRKKGREEDYRYAGWRNSWGRWFVLRSYFQIFILQGFLMLLISIPVVLIGVAPGPALSRLDLAGAALWIIGFIFEAGGDGQLAKFKKNPENKGRIITSGLWKLTRHPNYFGEAAMWWGIYIIALSVPWGWAAAVSPLVITFLLLRVSGIRLLEKKYAGNPEFQAYARTTNAFFPWFPKKAKSD